jgi:FtsZ-binding cell division protein ZapB
MSIFEKEETQETKPDSQAGDTSVNNSFDDLLNNIKNDSGERKYSSVESALEALKHSQEYIPTLKDEKNSMSQELEKFRSQQAKLDDLTSIVEKLTAPKDEGSNQTRESYGEQDVAKLVQEALNQNKAQSTRESNTQSVTSALAGKFGTEAEKEFYGKAKELGMTQEAFNHLAATSPKAVLSFFGDIAQEPSMTRGSQSVNHSFEKPKPNGKVDRAEKSVMAGASTRDLQGEMARHKAAVYAKYGVQH